MMRSLWSLCRQRSCQVLVLAALLAPSLTLGADPHEFFEARIRPVLVERCYECHNSADQPQGGLALDHRQAMAQGGASGALLDPANPSQSRLIRVLRHEIEGQEMPSGGARLPDTVIADFIHWIEQGAVDPREQPPTANELTALTSWDTMFQKRKSWWSFQPIQAQLPPAAADPSWSNHPIDAFLQVAWQREQLPPAAPASRLVLLRRLKYALTGLPPTREEQARFLNDTRSDAYERLVDELLASEDFGERWARHWMDWTRYAETHGSEGDPEIVHAWHYRDYLIRALNEDISCAQLIREHIAGDLLPNPRINHTLGIHESILGTIHWRMVFHGFAPTDALDEKVRFTDDQINAFTKAFLGITVACARCHNHKFDAISQADYYALFGILGSCRPGRSAIDLPENQAKHQSELNATKPLIRAALVHDWTPAANQLAHQLLASTQEPSSTTPPNIEADAFYAVWHQVVRATQAGQTFAEAWPAVQTMLSSTAAEWRTFQATTSPHDWRFSRTEDARAWFTTGWGLNSGASDAGDFSVAAEGDAAVTGIYPAGIYSHLHSSKHAARLSSPNLIVDQPCDLWMRVIGDGGAACRYVVQNYPRDGTVYPVRKITPSWQWVKFDLSYWKGDAVHFELTTARDAPLLASGEARSWFGVQAVRVVPQGDILPPASSAVSLALNDHCSSHPPTSLADLAMAYQEITDEAVVAFGSGQVNDLQAEWLDAALRAQAIPNQLTQLPNTAPLIAQYRQWETEIPVPTRVPTLEEMPGRDQALFERGNHKKPGAPIPRRFLEAIDARPYPSEGSGRRELAESVLSESNPLTRRVLANRIWHHLLGRGIVSTPDNLGQLGDLPTHPELLDYLAVYFEQHNWSLKSLVRLIVTSRAWQFDSLPTPESTARDPDNRWLSHAHLRRLEAEALRDAILQVSGELRNERFGPPIEPLTPRRSVYLPVRRNSLDPFLRAFDFPEPFSCTGRRDVTNVPAQSLTMLNDPAVKELASQWASRILTRTDLRDDDARVDAMFATALGRTPTSVEAQQLLTYVDATRKQIELINRQRITCEATRQSNHTLLQAMIQPQQSQLRADRDRALQTPTDPIPTPRAAWTFTQGTHDLRGTAHLTLMGDAFVDTDGWLVLNGTNAFALSSPLSFTVRDKSLEAVVQLENLDQSGGGVVSLQTGQGSLFDAIVFGELEPRCWLAGSDNHNRTRSFRAPAENNRPSQPIHLVITYSGDGTITAYRNGAQYGESYVARELLPYPAGESQITLGLRHLPALDNRYLRGRLAHAALYDRVLTPVAIEKLATTHLGALSEKQAIASLDPAKRAEAERLTQENALLQRQLTELGPAIEPGELTVWTDLARTLFTLKEFLYVR